MKTEIHNAIIFGSLTKKLLVVWNMIEDMNHPLCSEIVYEKYESSNL